MNLAPSSNPSDLLSLIPAEVRDLAGLLDTTALTTGSAAPPQLTPPSWDGTKTAAALACVTGYLANQSEALAAAGEELATQARQTAEALSSADFGLAAQVAAVM